MANASKTRRRLGTALLALLIVTLVSSLYLVGNAPDESPQARLHTEPASPKANPASPDDGDQPSSDIASTSTTAPASTGATDLAYRVQFSGTLESADWQESSVEVSVESIDDEWERVIVEDSESVATAARRFARVSVELLQK